MSKDSTPTAWGRLIAAALGGCALGAVVAASLSLSGRSVPRVSAEHGGTGAAAASAADLAPDPAVVHYKFAATGMGSADRDRADLADSIKQLEARVKHFDKSPYDWNDLAESYIKRAQEDGDVADYAAAEEAARKSLAIIRNPNAGLLTLAKALGARHAFREAIALANEHLAQKKTPAAYNLIATDELALGELPQATEAANTAIAMKPDAGNYMIRALVYQAQGRDAEAAWDFARSATVEAFGDPRGASHLRALWGRFLLRRGDYAGAQLVIDEALKIVPDYALAVAQRGELLLRTGHAKDAAKLFEQAFVASRQVRYLIDQARAQELAGDRAGADSLRDQVETIVRGELDGGGLGHRLDLVEVLVDRNAKVVEAIALAREEVARRPSAEARFQLARALARTPDKAEAIDQVQGALATGVREAQIYELAARLEAGRGNASRAAMYTRQADELDPAKAGWRGLGMDAPPGSR